MSQGATKRNPGRPKIVDDSPRRPDRWESPAIAKQVDDVLAAVEAPAVDRDVRMFFQRMLYRGKVFNTDGEGQALLILRTVLESEANGPPALIEPVVSAVASCMHPAWTSKGLKFIEAFDQLPMLALLDRMRGLDLFPERELGWYLGIALNNKLAKIFQPADRAAPAKIKKQPKPPARITRAPGVAKYIELGMQLLALRATTPSNARFGQKVRQQFNIDGQHACEAMKVARMYGKRPEIHSRLSWHALLILSSPKIPPSIREALERRVIAGEKIGAPQIKEALARRTPGRAGCLRKAA